MLCVINCWIKKKKSLRFQRLLRLLYLCQVLCFTLRTLFSTTLLYSKLYSTMYTSVLVLFCILRLFLQVIGPNLLYLSDKEHAWKRKLSVGKLQKSSEKHENIIQCMQMWILGFSRCTMPLYVIAVIFEKRRWMENKLWRKSDFWAWVCDYWKGIFRVLFSFLSSYLSFPFLYFSLLGTHLQKHVHVAFASWISCHADI